MRLVLVTDEGVLGILVREYGHFSTVRYYVDGIVYVADLEPHEYEELDAV